MYRFLIVCAVVLAAGTAHAERFNASAAAYVNTTSRYARGSLSDTHHAMTRSSGASMFVIGTSKYIGCNVQSYAGSSDYVRCNARDGSKFATCYAFDEHLVRAAQSISSASYINFTWDASGRCQSLVVSNDSRYYNQSLTEGQEYRLWYIIKNTIIGALS